MSKITLMAMYFVLVSCATTSNSRRFPSDVSGVNSVKTNFESLEYSHKILNLRIGIQDPAGTPVGDILYIHGFSDRLDNHAPLFQAWSRAGFRVISFDLPSHGENSGSYNDLNNFSFHDLADLVVKVEQRTRPQTPRPLILAGWSTGGLVVVRMLQQHWTMGLTRDVSGAILFTPGVSVRKFPWTFGNRLGEVTESTLSHNPNPPHVGSINPKTPFWNHLIIGFAPKLVAESVLSQNSSYPDVPTLVFTGGDAEDVYAKEWVVREWVAEQNESEKVHRAFPLVNISCPHAAHEMDNETDAYGGAEVRNSSAAFATMLVRKSSNEFIKKAGTFGPVCRNVAE